MDDHSSSPLWQSNVVLSRRSRDELPSDTENVPWIDLHRARVTSHTDMSRLLSVKLILWPSPARIGRVLLKARSTRGGSAAWVG